MKTWTTKTGAFLRIVVLFFMAFNVRAQCTFGNFPPTYTNNSGYGPNYLLGTMHNCPNPFFLTGLGFQGNNTGSGIQMALYSDNAGMAGTLLAQTSTVATVGSGNTTLAVITPTLLPPGNYWIMALYNQNANHVPKSITATNTVCYVSVNFGNALPFTTVWTTYVGQDFNYWAVSAGIAVQGPTSICVGSSATLTASGANSYTWSTGSNSPSIVVNPTVNTSYTVNGTGAACPSPNILTLTVNPIPTVAVSGSSVLCAGSIGSLVASGAISYTWSNNGLSPTVYVSPTVNTTYTVIGNSSGCMSSSSKSVNVLPTPVVSVTGPNTVCLGSSIINSVAGTAASYTWTGGSTSSTILSTPVANSFLSLSGSGTNGCISYASYSITVVLLPTVSVNSGTICSGKMFTINPSGGDSYVYSGGNAVVSPTVTSTYTVTGTSSLRGCANSAVSNVVVLALPTLTVNNGFICAGQSFTIEPGGIDTFTISGGQTVVNPTITTTYSITGTGTNGCLSSQITATLIVNSLPTINITSSSPVLCKGESATITLSGASSYSWNSGSTATLITVKPLVAISYTVNGIDINGCANKSTFTQSVNPCAGLQENDTWSADIKIYPNPTNDKIVIDHAEGKILLYSSSGQLIFSCSEPVSSTVISLNEFEAGIYFVCLRHGSNTIVRKVILE